MTFVFENIEGDKYQEIRNVLCSNFGEPIPETIDHCTEALKFKTSEGNLSSRYFKTKKLMLQCGSEKVKVIVSKVGSEIGLASEAPANLEKYSLDKDVDRDFFLGFDEAGKGETFGSLFLGGVKIRKENVTYLQGMLKGKNVKKLSKQQIDSIYNAIKGKFDESILKKSPAEIDSLQMNTLLDRGYLELIGKLTNEYAKEAIFIDDYGLGYELTTELNNLKESGCLIFATNAADIKSIACSIASLISRRARLAEMERLSKENVLIHPETGKKVSFESGSSANQETEEYLTTHRTLYPFSSFPSFVRTKWGNVREIERRLPKKENTLSFKCKYCNHTGHKICIHYDSTNSRTECFCPACGKEIDVMELKGFFKNNEIIMDTSAVISRIVSKDLETCKHLEGCKFIIPSIMYEELDTKQPPIKIGGNNEVDSLRGLSEGGQIGIADFDVEDYSDVQNDKKFLRVLRAKNGVMLTKDANLALFSEIGEFVIHVIDDKAVYLKRAGIAR